jgi:hypothetical protein
MEQVIPLIIALAFCILIIASMWVTFTKANEPGWAAIIPIYNIVVLLKITGKPIWWLVLFIIPIVNWIAPILVMISLAKSFGKGAGFGVGLALLGPIFLPMLAFGDAKYQGPSG